MLPLSDGLPARRFPVVNVTLIAACFAVWLFYELPDLNAAIFHASFYPCTIDNACHGPEPWGISWITAMFLHGGFLHLAGNMLYLWVFGDNVEDAFGHLGYVVFYAVSGVAAGLTHIAANAQSSTPSIGASGAIAGVLGAYLIMFPHASVRTLVFIGPFITMPRLSALFLIGFWFVLQLFSGVASLGVHSEQTSGVAFWAHIGGFLAGVVLALLFRPRRVVYSPG